MDYPGMDLCYQHVEMMREDPDAVMELVRNKAIKKARRKGAK
jgi:hypothetical protein